MTRRSTTVKLEAIGSYLRDLVGRGEHDKALSEALAMIGQLSTRLDQLMRERYGRKSEKLDASGLQLVLGALQQELAEQEPEAPAPDKPVVRPTRERGEHPGRNKLPASLPREEVRRAPPAEQRTCEACGQERREIRDERSELLEWTPGSFKVIEEVREVHACSCGQSAPITAPAGPRVIEGGLPGPGLLAQVVIGKYRDHLPLERQARIYKRHGVDISPKTMVGWVEAAAWLLGPLAQRIHELVMQAHVVQADDTSLLVLKPGSRETSTARGRIWAFVGDGRYVSYAYAPNWKAEHPARLLEARRGWLQVDGYAGYNALFKQEDGPVAVGCWMHARRYFKQALDSGDGRAARALELIGAMYDVERASKQAQDTHAERLARRKRETEPLLDALGRWTADTHNATPPRTPLGKALGYLVAHWPALSCILDDGALELDNGAVERALRGIAIGRKNWLFAGSDAGAERAAVLYTLIQSAVQHGLEPWAYLSDVMQRLAAGWPQRRLDELLPHRWIGSSVASAAA